MQLKIETNKYGITTISSGINLASDDELNWALTYLNALADQLYEEVENRNVSYDEEIVIVAADIFPDIDLPPLPKFDDDQNPD